MPILEVNHINKSFGATRVLDDISFSLERGKALAIIGSSGSGKTTLLRCLNFLETPNAGQIIVNGETLFDAADHSSKSDAEIRKRRLHFGMVFQSFNLFPQYTALENRAAQPDEPGGPYEPLSPSALGRPAAARGDRPRARPAAGYSVL